MIKDSQGNQSNMFAISLHYLKKEEEWSFFLHVDKYQSFFKLALSFLMEVDRRTKYPKYKVGNIFVIY